MATRSPDQPASQEEVIENEFHLATLVLFTGELVHLEVKRDGWKVLAGPGNVVARQHARSLLPPLNQFFVGVGSPHD